MPESRDVKIRFLEPPVSLRRYFNTFFVTEVTLPEGETISDFLMPSWGMVTLRRPGGNALVEYSSGKTFSAGVLTVTGPFCRAARVTLGSNRQWGLGLLPAGWARFVGAPASNYANISADGHGDPAFAAFQPLSDVLHDDPPDDEAELARIVSHFTPFLKEAASKGEERIVAIFDALQDKAVSRVSQLADRANVDPRTLERVCNRAYGFPPKTLLRRQRFLRSMTRHSLDPKVSWTDAMDDTYHDQSQFVREFREFMGVSPTEYNAIARPLASPLVTERASYILGIDRSKDCGER